MFTDHFVLEALSEYAIAASTDQDIERIETTYDSIEKRTYNPEQHDFARFANTPRMKQHSVYITTARY